MTDQPPSGPTASPVLNPASPPPDFSGPARYANVRVPQLAKSMGEQQPAADAPQSGENPRSRGHSPARDARERQQALPEGAKVKIGDAEYLEADVHDAMAARAEAAVRKSALPQSADGYQVTLPTDFQMPVGVPAGTKFEFDMKSPELALARQIAHADGVSQETFSKLLGAFAANKVGELANQARTREANLAQLGAAGPQRIEGIATWLSARAGRDGAAVGNFLRQFPSAPIVRAMENLIKAFSSQGGTAYSPQHRETVDANANAGRIAGYENMSFAQRRAAQMTERMRTDPNYARGTRPGGRGE